MKPSADYVDGLRLSIEQHKKTKNYNGKFLRPHRRAIKAIIDRLGCTSALDYGCGRGTQYTWTSATKSGGGTMEEYWGIPVTKYDPAYAPFASEPRGTFDLVICTHVLGIIPTIDLEEWVINRLFGFAEKVVYIALKTGATQKHSKSRWRPANIPVGWSSMDWIDCFTRHRRPGLEVQFAVNPSDPKAISGTYVITDAGLRSPV